MVHDFCASAQAFPFMFVAAAVIGISAAIGFVVGYEVLLRRWHRAVTIENYPLFKFERKI